MSLRKLFVALLVALPKPVLAAGNAITTIFPIPAPDVSIDFSGDYSPQGNIPSLITTTRASIRTCSDTAGNYHQVGNNVACYTNQGLLIEESRTNSIRNNTMQGAVVGSPGTLPTNWFYNIGGLSSQVVGTGVENGVGYIDLRIFGTTTQLQHHINFEAATQIAASQNQSWSGSFFAKQVGGSQTNISATQIEIVEYNNVGTQVNSLRTTFTLAPSSAALGPTRTAATYSLPDATAAFTSLNLDIVATGTSVAVDITVRIGWPQLELGSFSTSPIPTTNAAVTRAADSIPLTSAGSFGSAYTEYAAAIPNAPITYPTQQIFLSLNRTSLNRIALARLDTTGLGQDFVISRGATVYTPQTINPLAQSVLFKTALSLVDGNYNAAWNGVAAATGIVSGLPQTPTNVQLGSSQLGSSIANGYISAIKVWRNVALSPQALQRITQ